jgi:hypothetical protein
MALVRVAQYGSVPGPVTDYQAQNAHLQAFTNQLLTQQFILDSGTAQPVIKQGCYVSHGGSLYVADADTSITGSPSDGSVYIRVSGSTSLTVEFINDISGYVWNPVYTALTSGSYTLLPYLIVKASSVWTRYNFNPNNQSFGDTRLKSLAVLNNATVGGTLGVTGAISGASVGVTGNATVGGKLDVIGAISGASVDTGQGANKLYAMNQNVRTTDSPSFSTLGFASLNPGNSTETSIELSAGNTQVIPRGAYAINIDSSVVACQMKYGSNWIDIFRGTGGFVISDGVNFRLSSGSSGTAIIKMRKW